MGKAADDRPRLTDYPMGKGLIVPAFAPDGLQWAAFQASGKDGKIPLTALSVAL